MILHHLFTLTFILFVEGFPETIEWKLRVDEELILTWRFDSNIWLSYAIIARTLFLSFIVDAFDKPGILQKHL